MSSDSEFGVLAHPDTLPESLNPEIREKLRSHMEAEWDSGDRLPQNNKITKELCEVISGMYEDGMSVDDILDYILVSSPNAIYYHLRGDCSHQYRAAITYSECGWMRVKAQRGATTKELSDEYGIAPRNIAVHATGKCSHEEGIEPVSGDELFRNARVVDNTTTSVCPQCKEEFTHKEYNDRVTCSDQCNAEYASQISAEKRAARSD